MNKKVVTFQLGIFVTQWGLMLIGFGLLTRIVAPATLVGPSLPLGRYLDAGVKGLIALGLSVVWLFIWDRQVRLYFFRRSK